MICPVCTAYSIFRFCRIASTGFQRLDSPVEKIRNGYLDSPHVKIASVTRHDVQVPIIPVIPVAPVQQIRPFDIDGQLPLAKVAHYSHCEVVVGELVSGERITRTGIGKVCV